MRSGTTVEKRPRPRSWGRRVPYGTLGAARGRADTVSRAAWAGQPHFLSCYLRGKCGLFRPRGALVRAWGRRYTTRGACTGGASRPVGRGAQMADVALREVLQAAQDDLEGGAPRAAIVACGRVLRHYPEALTALRLLGEAHLELGQADEAREHFDRALALDPYNLPSRIGLAVLAEDRGDLEGARAVPARDGNRAGAAAAARRAGAPRPPAGRHGRAPTADADRARQPARAQRGTAARHPAVPARPRRAARAPRSAARPGAGALAARRGGRGRGALPPDPRRAPPHRPRGAPAGRDRWGDGGAPADATESARCLLAAREGDPDAALARELVALRPSGTLAEFISESHTIPAPDPASRSRRSRTACWRRASPPA